MRTSILVFVLSLITGCSVPVDQPVANAVPKPAKETQRLYTDERSKLEPFFVRMAAPRSSDWLEAHNEPGETFEEYLNTEPRKPGKNKRTIYVLPLGAFTRNQKKVVEAAADYLKAFFGLPIKMLPERPLIATHPNVRQNRFTKTRQIKTRFILNEILKPSMPGDAVAMIAFTQDDLYPDDTMNYVFGQASLVDGVGVWSLARLDDNADAATFLRRTVKISAHETGHMFGMRHCTKYECVMSGTNHLGETDRRPIDACPECSAKAWWLSDDDPAARYERLAAFARKYGLTKEADEFRRKAVAVRSTAARR